PCGLPPRRHQRGARSEDPRRERPPDPSCDNHARRRAEGRRRHRRRRKMSILVGKDTKLIVQGITGSAGSFHTQQMIEYDTSIVAGGTRGRGGESFEHAASVGTIRVPVFDTVAQAVEATDANATVIFVPPPGAADAILEAFDAGVALVVCITEGVPV